ncbi:MAG: hypothetical protein J5641_05280 [Bacteroidales bacterium]|nr:hypothetical protein [Bacteroidales bacterium]
MKRWFLLLLVAGCLCGCSSKDDDTIDCKIYWQLYHTPKYLEENEIEQAFQETFCGYYEQVNDNTVIARNTTVRDVRSLTLKLASMADKKLTGTTDPQLDYRVEVRVYIDFGSYVEERWSKTY